MRDLVVVLLTVVLIGGSLALVGLDAPDGSLQLALLRAMVAMLVRLPARRQRRPRGIRRVCPLA
ncbi:hypothetical protein AB0K18_45485 [Nonomuraea sp. NPDC049421]|uniref:hypothetical protein n=1 Tax=Nonomuraea sp. NPDC049421 TaxID=3155275 RepID=UPI00343551B1